jgi:heme exporter protein B
MKAFNAIIIRDIKLATRSFGDLLTLVLFFIMIGIIVPIAVGPNKMLLATLAPGIVWMAAFL